MKNVTDAELAEIKSLREMLMEIITEIGELTLSEIQVQNDIKKQKERFAEFQGKERVLFEQLQNTYGTGRIDMVTGEITE